ncbi:MAG TPA: FixH family protein [Nannocystaceae bacterium]|nr:FixH family protein [Nannocystaceae bacterium]
MDVHRWFRGLPLAAVLALGCASDDDANDDTNDDADDDDDDGNDTSAAVDCSTEMRDDTYMLGLSKTGEQVVVSFVDAMPAPPARGDNTWTFEVMDLDEQPMDGMAVEATPFMPDHQHGTTVVATVTPGENPGEYVATPVNLWMAGLWEVTLDFTLPDMTTDSVVFRFCVDP